MSDVIYLSNVRLSFPHIAEPQRQKNETTGVERVAYNADFVMVPDHEGFKQFMQRVAVLAQEKWKEHASVVLGMIQNERKTRCYGRGEEKVNKKTFQPYDGYAGMVYISASRDTMPQIIDPSGKPVDPINTMAVQALARKMYGGCRVNVAVKPWMQDNKHGRGVRADLVAIQFAADDKPFGEGATDVSGIFGAVATPAAAPSAAAPAMPMPPFMIGQ